MLSKKFENFYRQLIGVDGSKVFLEKTVEMLCRTKCIIEKQSLCTYTQTRNARNKIGSGLGRRGSLLMASCEKTDWHIRRRSDTLLIFYQPRANVLFQAFSFLRPISQDTHRSIDLTGQYQQVRRLLLLFHQEKIAFSRT